MSSTRSAASELAGATPDRITSLLGIRLPEKGNRVVLAGPPFVRRDCIPRREILSSQSERQTAEATGPIARQELPERAG